MRRSILIISIICLLAAGSVFGAIPKQISYQGILSGSTGNPLADSTVNVEFRIYNAAAGGNSVWIETQSVTTDEEGRFNVMLGSIAPIEDTVFRETERYLSINVASNGEIVPRTKLVSVGYSNRVSTVDGATGGIISGNTSIQSDLTVSGKVGVGTNTPLSDLHLESSNPISEGIRIYNTSASGDPTISFLSDGVFQYTLGVDNDESDKFQISGGSTLNSSERLTITSTGDVGIGTTSPAAKLHVLGATGDEVARFQAPPATASPYMSLWYNAFEGARIQTVNDVSDGGSLRFFTAAPPFGSVFERMRISSNGNVGIGTTSPSRKLHVAGNARVDDTLFTSNVSSLSPMKLQTGGITRMYISDATGNVGIGTTSPSSPLEVVGDLKVGGNIIGSTPWTDFPFAAGYQSYESGHPGSGFQFVQYRKIGDIVYLRGTIHKTDHAAIPLAAILGTLPVGFRPPAIVRFMTDPGFIDVHPTGNVTVSNGLLPSADYHFLDGASFSTSSTG